MSNQQRKKSDIFAWNRHFSYTRGSTIGETGGDTIYQIYLDSYFVLNFWMNLWVLFLCKIFVHRAVSCHKIIGITFFATLIQCVILLVPMGNAYIKLILGFGMVVAGSVWLVFRPSTLKQYYRMLLSCYIAALVLGGSLQTIENLFFFDGLSFLNLIGVSALLGILFFRVAGRIKERKKRSFVQVRLIFPNEENCMVRALVDSGNSLTDPISGKAVSLVEKRALTGITGGLLPSRFRVVPFHSVGCREGLLEAYGIEKLEVEQDGEWKQIDRPVIGIINETISAKEKYQMILHPALLDN